MEKSVAIVTHYLMLTLGGQCKHQSHVLTVNRKVYYGGVDSKNYIFSDLILIQSQILFKLMNVEREHRQAWPKLQQCRIFFLLFDLFYLKVLTCWFKAEIILFEFLFPAERRNTWHIKHVWPASQCRRLFSREGFWRLYAAAASWIWQMS